MQRARIDDEGRPPSNPLHLVMRLRGWLAAEIGSTSEEDGEENEEPLMEVNQNFSAVVLDDDNVTDSGGGDASNSEEVGSVLPSEGTYETGTSYFFIEGGRKSGSGFLRA